MAMNVKFLQGSSTNFNKITTKEANTFYYVTDKKALYLGANLIGDGVSTEAFEALKTRVKTLEDWKVLLATETSKTSASTTSIPDLIAVTVKTKDGAVSGVSVNDAALRSLISSYITNVTFNTYKQEQDSRDDGQDSKIAALEETIEGIVNVGGEANLVDDVQINGTTIVADKIANLAVEGNYSSTNKIATMSTVLAGVDAAKGYTNAEITGLELVLSEDGKTLNLNNKAGTAVATLDTTEFVVDGFLTRVEANQENNTLTFYWNTDLGEDSTEIALSSIADIYTGTTNNDGISINVSNTNEISAVISSALEARIAKGETALGWGNHADAGYANKVSSAVAGNFAGLDANGNLTDSGKKADDFATKAQGEAGVAAKTVTDALKSAAFVETTAFDAAGTGAAAAKAIQGSTTNTVKDCVDAINALNAGTAQTNKDINAISTSINDVVSQLTWGSF